MNSNTDTTESSIQIDSNDENDELDLESDEKPKLNTKIVLNVGGKKFRLNQNFLDVLDIDFEKLIKIPKENREILYF
jgi:hypothetical protein